MTYHAKKAGLLHKPPMPALCRDIAPCFQIEWLVTDCLKCLLRNRVLWRKHLQVSFHELGRIASPLSCRYPFIRLLIPSDAQLHPILSLVQSTHSSRALLDTSSVRRSGRSSRGRRSVRLFPPVDISVRVFSVLPSSSLLWGPMRLLIGLGE